MPLAIAAAARMKKEYRDIGVPVVIMAGTDDRLRQHRLELGPAASANCRAAN